MSRFFSGNGSGGMMDRVNNMYGRGSDSDSNNGSNTGLVVIGVIGILLLLALLILLIIHMVAFGLFNNQFDDLYTHKFCPAGDTCKNGALVGGSGICSAQGECIGTAKGQCDSGLAPFDFGPNVDCRNLTFSWPVDTFNLFNAKFCWFGRCVYVLEGGLGVLDWSCAGVAHGRYELKELGAKRCRSFISEDPDAPFFDTTLTCISDEPLCMYSIEAPGFNYPYIEGPVAPWIVGGAGAGENTQEGPTALSNEEKVLLEMISDAYQAHKQQHP